jgi:WD40 repeat protein
MEARRALLTGLQSFSSFMGPVALLKGNHAVSVWSVAFSPDGKLLASGGEGGLIQLWEVEHRRPLGDPLAGHTDDVRSVAFSPDGKLLASGEEEIIQLWEVEHRRPLGEPLEGHTEGVMSVAFSPDGKLLASGGGR